VDVNREREFFDEEVSPEKRVGEERRQALTADCEDRTVSRTEVAENIRQAIIGQR